MIPMMRGHRDTVREYLTLPRPIWALAGARLVNAAGSFVFPFLTLLLTDRIGFDAETAGRIIMISTVMFVPGSLIGGALADRIGRKRLLIGAQGLAALCLGLIGFMPMDQNVVWLILAQQFFTGLMMPASSAATYDLTEPGNRKAAFSLLYLSWNLGFAIGPLLAGYLYESHARWLFLGDAGTTFLSLLFIVFLLPETRPAADSPLLAASGIHASNESPREGSAIRLLLQRPILLMFVAIMAVPWFIYGQHSFTLPLFAKELFPARGAFLYGKIMSLNAILVVLLTVPIIRLTRKIRPVINVAIHSALYAVGFGMLALFQFPAAFYISVLIWTTGEILGATNIEVFSAEHTPSSHRGRFTSILPLISGSGRALSPWLTGIYLIERPISSAWTLCFVLGSAAAIGFLFLGITEWRKGSGAIS